MKKKIISGCLALSLFATAFYPMYKHLELSNTLHPPTESFDSEKVSATQHQNGSADDTVTYPPEYPEILRSEIMEYGNSDTASINTETSDTKEKVATTTATAVSEPVQAAKKAESVQEKQTPAKSSVSQKATLSSRSKTPAKQAPAKQTPAKQVQPKQKTPDKPAATPANVTKNTSGSSSAAVSKASAVITTAKSLMGIPYVWGGTTTSGFDCSGFIQYVFAKHGINLPRTSAEQYTVGTGISKSSLKAGDLVFFTTYKAGPSHLGIYLGDGNFIHASSSKGVVISSLNSAYYAERYVGSRRVIK